MPEDRRRARIVAKFRRKFSGDEELRRYVAALYDILAGALGADKVVMRAGKLGALKLMRSPALGERLLALQRLVFEDPTLERLPAPAQYRETLSEIEDGLADLIAQRNVEDSIERKISEKMASRHQEYLKDLKLEALKEDGGPETPATQRKLDELKALEGRRLNATALDALRPKKLERDRGARGRDRGAACEDRLAVSAARDLVRAARRR